jgi:hypothetical protein
MRWAGHVARMGVIAYRDLSGKPEGTRPLSRPERRWEENISEQLRLDTTYYNLVVRYLISKSHQATRFGRFQANTNNKITKYISVLHGIPFRLHQDEIHVAW